MDVSYKFFVHLYDMQSGELVTQVDVMPYGYTYFTNWWESGEVVSDEVLMDLSEVSPGEYQLAVGVYDPDTGERLVIEEHPADFVVDERRLFLPGEIVH